ncbi:MAG: hypothetical protein WA130_02060 [Candidatus Methanoperedens sp.]
MKTFFPEENTLLVLEKDSVDCYGSEENKPQINADERTINTFGQSQGYCAGVATPDPGEAPPMAEFNMI